MLNAQGVCVRCWPQYQELARACVALEEQFSRTQAQLQEATVALLEHQRLAADREASLVEARHNLPLRASWRTIHSLTFQSSLKCF
jgi:hypothetical protein